MINGKLARALRFGAAAVIVGFLFLGPLRKGIVNQAQTRGASAAAAIPTVPLRPPAKSSIPPGPVGESIRLGRNIIMNTPKYAAAYVGDSLTCSDCHLKGGTVAYASPLAGVTTLFPLYLPRSGRVISIQERIEECFLRSENGKRLPVESPEMIGMIAYMAWLSKGVPSGSTVQGRGLPRLQAPAHVDRAAGAEIYAARCAMCHGVDGAGVPGMSPALWGPRSFNDGAGMSYFPKMAAFVKANMPPTQPGSLTTQEAFNVADYVDAKPRTHFTGK
ncbi:MAG: c-type cytochrome [Terriglobia bacterium]